MTESDEGRRLLLRTQLLMVAVSLIPLAVLFYIAAEYALGPLRDSGQFGALFALFATLSLTALVVVLGYTVVRRDTLRTIEAIGAGEARLERLRVAATELAALDEPDALRQALVASAGQLTGAARVALWERERDDLTVRAAVGLSLERAGALALPVGQGVVGQVAASGASARNPTLTDTDRTWDDRVHGTTSSALVVPLVQRGEVVAVLDVRNAPQPFTSSDQRLVEGLAQQATLFLDNARFRAAAAARATEIERLLEAVGDRLTWKGHIGNLRTLTAQLADAVGLPDDRRAALRRACIVHDLGLLDAPPTRSGPPGGPRDHAASGARRLAQIEGWDDAAALVKVHHEHMDGSGPGGLRGFALPMAGRILALAEYVETATNPASPWGKRTVADLIDELRDPKDRRFDPAVVDAFVALHRPRTASEELADRMDDSALDEVDFVR